MSDIRAGDYPECWSWFAALPFELQESTVSASVAGGCSIEEIWSLLVVLEPISIEAAAGELQAAVLGAIDG